MNATDARHTKWCRQHERIEHGGGDATEVCYDRDRTIDVADGVVTVSVHVALDDPLWKPLSVYFEGFGYLSTGEARELAKVLERLADRVDEARDEADGN